MHKFTSFYEAWRWLNSTIIFFNYESVWYCHEPLEWFCSSEDPYILWHGNDFINALSIEVVKVNPITKSIVMFKPLNTKTRIWLECGKVFYDPEHSKHWLFSHDWNWDCGADSFEEAIIILANMVWAEFDTEDKLKAYKDSLIQMMKQYDLEQESKHGDSCR